MLSSSKISAPFIRIRIDPVALPRGRSSISKKFQLPTGTGTLLVDGKEVAKKSMENTIPIDFPEDETFDVGLDTRTGVAMLEYRYDCPFKFTGKINKLTFDLGPSQMTAEDRKQMPSIADRVARLKD